MNTGQFHYSIHIRENEMLTLIGKSRKTVVHAINGYNLVLITSCDSFKQMYSDYIMNSIAISPKMYNLNMNAEMNNLFGDGSFLIGLRYNNVPKNSTNGLTRYLHKNRFTKFDVDTIEQLELPKSLHKTLPKRFGIKAFDFMEQLANMQQYIGNYNCDFRLDAYSGNFAINNNGRIVALDLFHNFDEKIKLKHRSNLLNRAKYSTVSFERMMNEAIEENGTNLVYLEQMLMDYEYGA